MTTTTTYNEAVAYVPRTGTLYDVLELILDRGMVIDIFVRVSLVGIEIIKIDARVVVASVDTYLRFAEVCNRLDLANDPSSRTVPDLFAGVAGGVTGGAAKKAAKSVGGKVKDALGASDSGDGDDEDGPWEYEETEKPRKHRDSGAASGPRVRSGTSSRTRATRHAREE